MSVNATTVAAAVASSGSVPSIVLFLFVMQAVASLLLAYLGSMVQLAAPALFFPLTTRNDTQFEITEFMVLGRIPSLLNPLRLKSEA